MGLFEGNAIKKVNKLLDNAEKRKTKLANKVETLQEEANQLYQEVQNDFNEAILEDKEPSKKLSSDLEKVREELRQAQFQLSQIDVIVQAELEKAKAEVEKERREFVQSKGEDFRKLFDEMNEIKLAYLNKVIEYSKKKTAYNREYNNTFREVGQRVKLGQHDPFYDFHIGLNQRFQQDGAYYSPMVRPDELRDALEGKLSFVTEKNKEAFKK